MAIFFIDHLKGKKYLIMMLLSTCYRLYEMEIQLTERTGSLTLSHCSSSLAMRMCLLIWRLITVFLCSFTQEYPQHLQIIYLLEVKSFKCFFLFCFWSSMLDSTTGCSSQCNSNFYSRISCPEGYNLELSWAVWSTSCCWFSGWEGCTAHGNTG